MVMPQEEHNPAVEPQSASAPGKQGRQTLKTTSPWGQGDSDVDPQEYARLLDLYDNSFRNIAEGEVVKGTVLKVTES